eukprot:GFUD01023716.1.p1 GENE.GFUD01023716.1~~GFUD01023716.1.p1  ORF type:complete len:319 (+),score=90.72 GFUD01023716.1:134-958(+)
MESEEFRIKLIGATQHGVQNYAMEFETDWEEVMSSLILCLETFPTDVERVEQMAQGELETWAREQVGGEQLNLTIQVKFSERLHSLSWVGGSKDVKVKFSDKSVTEANFIVVKKRILKSLQDLAADKVGAILKSYSAVSALQLPIDLRMAVKKSYFDQWTQRYFNKKMYHYLKTREVAKRVTAMINEPKKVEPNAYENKNVEKKKVVKVKRLETKTFHVDKKPHPSKMKPSLVKKPVDLGRLKECPVCEKTNLKNVKLHIARNKTCRKISQKYS